MTKWYKRISCLLLAALMVCGALASADNLTTASADPAEAAPSTQTDRDTALSSQEPVANTESTDSTETKDNTDASDTDDPDPEPTPEPDPEPDPEEQFSFVSSSASVKAGKSVSLTLSCNVEDTVTDVTSSHPSVAQVSDFGGDQADGTTVTIAGLKKGTATITATTQNGYTATCRVTVTKAATHHKDDPSNKPNNNNQKPGNTTPTTPSTNIGSGSTSLTSGLTTTTYTKPDHIPSSVALTFSCSLGKYTDTILENMDTYNTYGTFFVPSKDIYRKDDRVRRIVGQGNAIGITLTKEQSSDAHKALRALKRANNRLSTVCGVPTRLVTIEGGSEQLSSDVYTALTDAGYRVWDSTYTVTANDVKTDTEKLESAMDTKKRVVVRMDTSKHSAEIMKEVLGYINFAAIPTKALADSDKPVCQAEGK